MNKLSTSVHSSMLHDLKTFHQKRVSVLFSLWSSPLNVCFGLKRESPIGKQKEGILNTRWSKRPVISCMNWCTPAWCWNVMPPNQHLWQWRKKNRKWASSGWCCSVASFLAMDCNIQMIHFLSLSLTSVGEVENQDFYKTLISVTHFCIESFRRNNGRLTEWRT